MPTPDQNIAIQHWLRTQLVPVMDRSLAAALGVSGFKKNPVGIRGKFWPDYSAYFGKPGVAKIPKHPWRDSTRQRRRKAPPIYFSRSEYVPSEMVEVQPHVYVNADFLAGRQSRPKIKHHGRPLGHLKTISVPAAKPSKAKPLAKHYWNELECLYRDRWLPGLWGTDVPWFFCKPTTVCEAYAVTEESEIVKKCPISLDAGFKLMRVGVCHGTWRDYPISTYIPYRRLRSGAVGSFIEPSDGDEMDDNAYLRLLLSDGEYRQLVEDERTEEIPETEKKNRDAWGEHLDLLREVSGLVDVEEADLARDMGTRYPWQAPLVLPSIRRWAWFKWFPPTDHAEVKRARAAERQRRHRARRVVTRKRTAKAKRAKAAARRQRARRKVSGWVSR